MFATTRCVGKIVSPSLRVLTKVIIAASYGAASTDAAPSFDRVEPAASDAAVAVATEADAPSTCSVAPICAAAAPAAAESAGLAASVGLDVVAASDGLEAVASVASALPGSPCSRTLSLRRSLR